jgi:hypothetical protein
MGAEPGRAQCAQTTNDFGKGFRVMRRPIPNAGDRLDQLAAFANSLRRHPLGGVIYIYAYFIKKAGAPNGLPGEDATDLRLARRYCLCYLLLSQAGQPRTLRKIFRLKPDVAPLHAPIMHLCTNNTTPSQRRA